MSETKPNPMVVLACCGNCRFWLPLPPSRNGACRRHPPTVIAMPTGRVNPVNSEPVFGTWGFFPPMDHRQWCGEHEPAMAAGDAMPLDDRLTGEAKGAA